MEFLSDSRYIVLPVNQAARGKKLQFWSEEKLLFDLDICLDAINPEFYAYYDMSPFMNRQIKVKCEPEMTFEIKKADHIDETTLYTEPTRPQVHFTAPLGWINDPNGLVYYKGEYHMFYQYNPVGTIWNNMHWGHAVSKNLVEWEDCGVALYPDSLGTMFSGSAIIDKKNCLGVKKGEEETIVLFYTAAGDTSTLSRGKKFTQCIAYSTDGGKTFEKYVNNPVVEHLEHSNRDPKVIYHEPTDRYIMALYMNENRYALLASENLTDWIKLQEISLGGDSECPDFYPLKVDGKDDQVKWVLSGASDQYIVGSFDGYAFHPETGARRLHHGDRAYAAQSWSNISDGRRIRIAWNRFTIPAKNFNMSMTIPCEMSLRTTEQGIVLCTYPVREIEELYLNEKVFEPITLDHLFSQSLEGKAYDISFEFVYKKATEIKVNVFGIDATFDLKHRQLHCADTDIPLPCTDGSLKVRMIADTAGIEFFLNDGSVYFVAGILADYNLNRIEISSDSEIAIINELKLNELKNIWGK